MVGKCLSKICQNPQIEEELKLIQNCFNADDDGYDDVLAEQSERTPEPSEDVSARVPRERKKNNSYFNEVVLHCAITSFPSSVLCCYTPFSGPLSQANLAGNIFSARRSLWIYFVAVSVSV